MTAEELIRTLEKIQSFGYDSYTYTTIKDYSEPFERDYTERAVVFYKTGDKFKDDCIDIDVTEKMAQLMKEDVLPIYGAIKEVIKTLANKNKK